MPTKRKSDIKQKQRQSQNVKVIVNLADKKKRKRRAKRRPKATETEVVSFKALPPQIIYPSAPLTFYSSPPEPKSLAESVSEKVKPPPSMLEDIGNIGTEGVGVEILNLPTRGETLAELETPVQIKAEKQPVSLGQSLKNEIPIGLTTGLSASAQSEVPVEPEVVAPAKSRKKRLSNKEYRQQMELEYQTLTGLPVKPIVTNKELKALIYAEKKGQKTRKGIMKIIGVKDNMNTKES